MPRFAPQSTFAEGPQAFRRTGIERLRKVLNKVKILIFQKKQFNWREEK